MASRKEYEMLFQLNAQLGSSYNSTFKNAQGAIASMQKEIAALSKTQSDVSAYQKQQAAVEASRKKLEVLQQQYDNIQKEMDETGSYSSALENRLLAKQQQIDKTSTSLSTQNAKLEQMSKALRDAGLDTSDLTGESAKLGTQIDELKSKQEEAADKANNFGAQATAAFGAVGQAIVAAGITVALKEIVDLYGRAAEASMEFESAMTGVDKTTELTDEELAAMGREIKYLSTEIPVVTQELAGIGEVAGQLGIQKDNLMDFSEVMAMLATATTMTAEEGATMLAQFANITQMDPSFYSNLASTIVALGNNYATTEQKITDMSQGIAASASLAGMTEADIAALSAAVTSLGIETQAGSTSMSKLISELMTAVETGDNLNQFARIANMSAEEFSDAWGDNAVTALQSFVVGLNDTERNGKSATVALTELGITETRMQRMILSLSNSGDLLNRTLATSSQAWTENTALTAEAEKRYATTQSQLTMMQNAYNNLGIAVGDNFTPSLRELYAVATDALRNITAFVEEHPALVKAITAFVGVIGLAVGGITAYVAIAKIATVVSAALTAAIPGLNIIMAVVVGVGLLTAGIVALTEASKDETEEAWELTAASREQYYQLQELNDEYELANRIYGETSYEAQELRWRIDDLTAEYEAGKQSLEEYKATHDELMGSYEEMTSSHTSAYEEIEKEQRSTLALIAKLEELTSTTDGATKNQQAILSIIEALNEAVPELALSYDDVVNSSGGFIDSLYAIAEAQSAQLLLEEQWNDYIDRVGKQDALKSAKEAAEYNSKIAQEEYDIAHKAWADAVDLYKYDTTGWGMFWGTRKQGKALDAAQEQLDAYNETLAESSEAYEENATEIAELESAFQSYQRAQEEAAESGENIREVITSITDQMAELSAAYEETYNAALDSISGQYKLWDEAAEIVATSAKEINTALESQIDYWQDYNTNLASLTERSADIKGLADIIASFADGSEGSVNAIAGMASATDDELAAMVSNWQSLQSEQKTVAESLAELETDFAASMNSLQQELESKIKEMNLSEDAAESGKNTIQGFIDGAEDMLPAVEAAYSRIAGTAVDAIDARLQIRSPSKVFADRGEYAMSGFVGGVEAMEPEVTAAMSNAASAGTEAFTSEEVQIVSFAPQFLRYLNALSGNNDAVSAEPGGIGGGNYIVLTVSPQYHIAGAVNAAELEAILRSNDDNLRELVLEIIEDAEIDKVRGAYT
ncbi:MAG: phage tail tape measure protein [Vallitaleaceae bacterium]|nr:phage tail tape measure protein [Vallitaleaceae bacterium]